MMLDRLDEGFNQLSNRPLCGVERNVRPPAVEPGGVRDGVWSEMDVPVAPLDALGDGVARGVQVHHEGARPRTVRQQSLELGLIVHNSRNDNHCGACITEGGFDSSQPSGDELVF